MNGIKTEKCKKRERRNLGANCTVPALQQQKNSAREKEKKTKKKRSSKFSLAAALPLAFWRAICQDSKKEQIQRSRRKKHELCRKRAKERTGELARTRPDRKLLLVVVVVVKAPIDLAHTLRSTLCSIP